jgi:hypothetical protein
VASRAARGAAPRDDPPRDLDRHDRRAQGNRERKPRLGRPTREPGRRRPDDLPDRRGRQRRLDAGELDAQGRRERLDEAPLEVWYRWWQSGDTAPTFTRTSGGAAIGRIFIVKGVGTGSGDPFDQTPTSQANTTTTTITAPTITPGAGNAADGLFLFGAEELTANTSGAPVQPVFGGTTPTPTQIFASRATGLGADMVSLSVSWGAMTSAGASGARTSSSPARPRRRRTSSECRRSCFRPRRLQAARGSLRSSRP